MAVTRENENKAEKTALARRAALVQIVEAVARSGGTHDVGRMVREVDEALRQITNPGMGPRPPHIPTPSSSARESGARWPFRAPAHPVDIEHSLGDGKRLRCFENGHWTNDLEPILARRGMTPDDYRRKWGLPAHYPMQSDAELVARAARTPWQGRMPTAKEIKASITPTWLISFEDGARYKLLARHLASRGLSPDDYRRKWGLPRDYPMTAPNSMSSLKERGRALAAKYVTKGAKA